MSSTTPAAALRPHPRSRPLDAPAIATPDLPAGETRPDSGADYRASHSGLLTSLYGPGRPDLPPEGSDLSAYGRLLGGHREDTGRRIGGIIVPTCRDFAGTGDGLMFAARLALTHGCPMVVIHSREARAPEFPQSVRDLLGDALIVLDLASVHESWRPGLASTEHELSTLHRSNDVGWKRNIGLMVAARFGWEVALFLDDDISAAETGPTLSAQHLAHALKVLEEDRDLMAVGWPLCDFDDNSVVGHARPLVGLPQDIFISSGALLLRITERTAFFPHGVYNEDWLAVLQTLALAPDYQRALARGGPVHQKEYEAFCPRRARSEEAGELLGEGLMNLVEDHGPGFTSLMSGRYWKRVMGGRRSLLRRIIRKRTDGAMPIWGEGAEPLSADPVVVCMNTALWAHRELNHRKLVDYASRWRADWDRWQSVLVTLAQEASGAEPETGIPQLFAAPRTPWTHSATAAACQDALVRSASITDRGWEVTV